MDFNLDQESTSPEVGLNLYPNVKNPLSEEVIRNRAARTHFALGSSSPGIDALIQTYKEDNEGVLRTGLAAEEQQELLKSKDEVLQGMATRLGSSATPEDITLAQSVARLNPTGDPNTIIERKFGNRFADTVLAANDHPDSPVNEAARTNPAATAEAADAVSDVAAYTELFRRGREEVADELQKSSWWRFGSDFVESMVPFLSQSRLYFPQHGGIDTVSNLKARVQEIWSLPFEQAAAEYKKDLETIKASSLFDAYTYADAFFGIDMNEQITRRMQNYLDVIGIGEGAYTGAKIAGAIRSATRAASQPATRIRDIAAEAGDLDTAARAGVAERRARERTGRGVIASRDPNMSGLELTDDLPMLVNPSPRIRYNLNRLHLDLAAVNRLDDETRRAGTAMLDMALGNRRATRMSPEAVQVAQRNADELFRAQYPQISANKGILNADIIPDEDTFSNTFHLKVLVGTEDGKLFKTEYEANQYAQQVYKLDIDRYTTAKGDVTFPADETVTGFKTAKGSTYQINADGTTTRNKAPRPEHTDSGLKPKSLKTVYMPEGVANKLLSGMKGTWRVVDDGSRLSIITRTPDVVWGRSKSVVDLPYSTTPKRGSVPVELWNHRVLQKEQTFGKVHVGNKITELTVETSPVRQQGNGFYIQITKPFSEIDANVREALTVEAINRNPDSLFNASAAFARGAKEVLAPFQMRTREIVTTVPQEMRRHVIEFLEPLRVLNKAERRRLNNVLRQDQLFEGEGPDGETVYGRRLHSVYHIETEWQSINGRLPSEKEVLAYLRYHQIMDLDFAIRNLGMKRDLDRLGVEMWNLPTYTVGEGITGRSADFMAIFRKELDWDSKTNWNVWIQQGPAGRLVRKAAAGDDKKWIEHLVKERGFQILQIPNPRARPLREITGDARVVHFIVSNELQSKPLPARLVKKNEGVHMIYPHSHKVVQAQIEKVDQGKPDYFGDQTVMLFHTEAEAMAFRDKVDELRRLFDSNADEATLRRYVSRNLPYDYAHWRREFGPDGRLSTKTPVSVTKMDQWAADSDTNLSELTADIEDHTRSPLNLFRQIDTSFLQDRGGPAIQGSVRGNPNDPIFRIERADVIDPLAALQKGISNALQSLHMNDYKISAIEQWASQYSRLAKDRALAESNPLYFFYNMKNMLKPDANWEDVQNAKWTNQRIRQFIGQQTEVGKAVRRMEEKIFNHLPTGVAKWYNVHEYPLIRDPTTLLRNAMVHSYFGVFNPLQYWVQLQTAAHVVFVAGRHGLPGLAAAVLQRMGLQFTEDPAILRHYARIASRMGFRRPEWFEESYKLMRQYGLMNIGGEHALRSDVFDPKLLRSNFKRVLDAGLVFFKEGERQSRMAAWNAAYLEFRKANPTKVLLREDEARILSRANTFFANMTRAGNSAMEEGLASIPLQFTTWNRRLIDQMWGKELTRAEKARAMIGHSVLYGVPMGVGIAVPWPFWDQMRKHALEKGYNMSDTFVRQLHDGLTGTLSSWLIGEDYDFTRRMGPADTDILYDLIYGDESFLETLLGPSGTFMSSFIKATLPLTATTYAALTGGEESLPVEDLLPNLKDSAVDLAKNVTSIGNAWKSYYMLNFQKYYNKNEQLKAADATGLDAAMLFFFGVQRQDWKDVEVMITAQKDREAAQRNVQNYAIQTIQRAYRSLADGDKDSYMRHLRTAKLYMEVLGDFEHKLIIETIRRATQLDRNTYLRARQRFLESGYKKDLPAKLQRLFDLP